MPDLKSIENISLIAVFVIPGLIALFVRAQFISGRLPPLNEAILAYLTLTFVYYGLVYPFLQFVTGIHESGWWSALAWFLLVIFGPAAFGTILGVTAQKMPFRHLLNKFGMNSVHPSPTAWDWWFSLPHDRWIIITLKDGTVFGGYFGPNSFASSDAKERDVFVEKIYVIEDDGMWTDMGKKGLWVALEEIRTLEFLAIEH